MSVWMCSDVSSRRRPSRRSIKVAALAAGLAMAAPQADAAEVAIFQIVDIQLIQDAVGGFRSALESEVPDVTFMVHDAQGQANLFPTMARQIVRDGPDLIAVIGTPIVVATFQAAQQAGSDVPIVFLAMGDPVGAGVADSFEKPGKQATGTTDWISPSDTLDTVLAVTPDVKAIGNIWDSSNQNGKVFHDALAEAVADRGLELVDVSIASPGEVFVAAQSLGGRAGAIVLGPDAAVIQGLPAIGGAALKNKIPFYVTAGDPATPGVLLGLGVDYGRLGALSGTIAAKILNGTPAGEIPIIGPDGFSLSLNGATAEALGITLPEDMMATAQTVGQ